MSRPLVDLKDRSELKSRWGVDAFNPLDSPINRLIRTLMDISSLSVRLPAYAAMLRIPWLILLSIARVRMGGIWLWGGALARACISLVFLKVMMS